MSNAAKLLMLRSIVERALDGLVCKVSGFAGSNWQGAEGCECWSCELRRDAKEALKVTR